MIQKTDYDINHLGSFEQEWLLHKGCQDWWYATGYFTAEDGHRFSYQFTILNLFVGPLNLLAAMLALTDFGNERHRYRQQVSFSKKGLTVDENTIAIEGLAQAVREPGGLHVITHHRDFDLDLHLNYGKGAFWHADNGRLQMGTSGDNATTYYYSYPNMPTTGTMILEGKEYHVTGKSWFDKQGGRFKLTAEETKWEWFSLRFYDNEEIMLFKFPKTTFQDGTFISRDGQRERLNEYTLTTTRFVEAGGSRYAAGWDLVMPGRKEEHYTITPVMDGCINLSYFEELCSVRNEAGEEVGMCFTELFPHIYDDYVDRAAAAALLKNVEY